MTAPARPALHPAVRANRDAVAIAFLGAGTAFGTFASRVPTVREELALTDGRLGLALLSISAGSVLALPAAGAVAGRIGVRRTLLAGVVLVGAGLVGAGAGVAVAQDVWALQAGLFLLGLGTGLWDVAMNLEGAAVERRMHRTVMPKFHAAFSLGTVLAAGLGALAIFSGVSVVVHLPLVVAVLLPTMVLCVRRFSGSPSREPDEVGVEGGAEADVPRRRALAAWAEPRTLLIGVVVLAAAFAEGAANDWLSLALVDGYDVEAWVGVLGLAVFLSAMTAGRFVGSSLIDRFGRVPLLVASLLTAGAGSALVVVGGSTPLAFAGALLWGLGASLGFPVGMSAAADDPRYAAARVSVVATIGYLAFLAGPPLLGFLADRVGVLHALVAVAVLVVPALLVVPAVRPPADVRDGTAGTGDTGGTARPARTS